MSCASPLYTFARRKHGERFSFCQESVRLLDRYDVNREMPFVVIMRVAFAFEDPRPFALFQDSADIGLDIPAVENDDKNFASGTLIQPFVDIRKTVITALGNVNWNPSHVAFLSA